MSTRSAPGHALATAAARTARAAAARASPWLPETRPTSPGAGVGRAS